MGGSQKESWNLCLKPQRAKTGYRVVEEYTFCICFHLSFSIYRKIICKMDLGVEDPRTEAEAKLETKQLSRHDQTASYSCGGCGAQWEGRNSQYDLKGSQENLPMG